MKDDIENKEEFCEHGEIFEAIPPVNMTWIADVLPCGKRGGPNFIETVRVDKNTLRCPTGLEPCS